MRQKTRLARYPDPGSKNSFQCKNQIQNWSTGSRVIAPKRYITVFTQKVWKIISKIAPVDFILYRFALKLSENMDLVYAHVNRVQKRI